MTEKEKRAQGMLHNVHYNEEIMKDLLRSKDLCYEYNGIKPSHLEEKAAALRKLLGKTGKRFLINAPFYCDFGYNIEIGEDFYANHNCTILDGANVNVMPEV